MEAAFALKMIPVAAGQNAKRCAIIEAATAAFCRDGFTGASIDAIAADAGVSRQTVYNQLGDKEKLFAAVVHGITARSSEMLFKTLGSFPQQPDDIEAELTAFAVRLTRNCMCDADGRALRRLIENEGQRYPELFETWREYGPGKNWPAIAARFAKLAHDGVLEIDDANLAARQFMALVNADLPTTLDMGDRPSDAVLETAARNAVRTFLRAYAPRPQTSSQPR
jgi:AcrR family transcriptional regulator